MQRFFINQFFSYKRSGLGFIPRLMQALVVLVSLLSPMASGWLEAGGSSFVTLSGEPIVWSKSKAIIYNPENGALKSDGVFGVDASLELIEVALETWEEVPGVSIDIIQGDFLPPVIANNNNAIIELFFQGTDSCYPEIFGPSDEPCLSPVIFDEDGSLVDEIFGACSRFSVLGFGATDFLVDEEGGEFVFNDPIVQRGIAAFNGTCIAPISDPGGCVTGCLGESPPDEVQATVTHELGHFLGLGHSQVNGEVFVQCQSNQEGCSEAQAEALPMMFPAALIGSVQPGLHKDDQVTFRRLYGDTDQHSCSVSGRVLASDGVTQVRGVEVIARNSNNSLELKDSIAFVSGAEAPQINSTESTQDNCKSDCGFYQIKGLSDGETYRLCVESILPFFVGGSSVPPVDPPFEGFSNDCPVDLVVECQCDNGTNCPQFTNVDILTDAVPAEQGGGCQLRGLIQAGLFQYSLQGIAFLALIFIRFLLPRLHRK